MWGLLIFLFALSATWRWRSGLAFGQGVANMVFIIPSQTLFQERTPPALMGRVVGFRFALVFGSMTIAMLLGSVLGEVFGPGAGHGGLRAGDGRRPGWPGCWSRRCAMRDRTDGARRLRYTGARAAPDDRGGREEYQTE